MVFSEVLTIGIRLPGTASPVPRLQAFPGLKVGLYQGPAPFHPGTCLPPAVNMPSVVPRLFVLRSVCRPVQSHPQPPPAPYQPPSSTHQQSGGDQSGRGLVCQAALNLCTPGWDAIVPSLCHNFVLPRSKLWKQEETRQWEQALSNPRSKELPGPLRVQECLGPKPWLGGCSCTRRCRAPALLT